MIFSSMIFLWLFLPVTLILYLAFLKIGKKSLQLLMNCVIMHIVDSVLVKEWGNPLFGFYYGNLPQHCFSRRVRALSYLN